MLSLTKRENRNAEEMKRRAREYRTFLLINVEPTTLVLSYRVSSLLSIPLGFPRADEGVRRARNTSTSTAW